MLKFLKQLNFIFFMGCLTFLTIFYIPQTYYTHWFITYLLVNVLFIYLSFKIFPSRKAEKRLAESLEQYKKSMKQLEDIRSESLMYEFTCPSCETKNTFWSFLDDYKCPKCSSSLWTTSIRDLDERYQTIFDKRDKIYNLIEKIPSVVKNKYKNSSSFGSK